MIDLPHPPDEQRQRLEQLFSESVGGKIDGSKIKKAIDKAISNMKRQEKRNGTPAALKDATDDLPERLVPVKPGDWWRLGDNLLYCGDSANPEFIAKAKGAALAFADPPYNAGVADWDEGFKWQHDYIAEIARIAIVTPGISAIPDFFSISRMPYKWSAACHITNGMTRGAMGFGNWVYMALFSRASVFVQAQDMFSASISSKDGDGVHHKGRKPLALLRKLIALFTEEGDTVVDPFLGSGTTLIASQQLKRRCVGAEIDPTFCGRIIARWEDLAKAKALLVPAVGP